MSESPHVSHPVDNPYGLALYVRTSVFGWIAILEPARRVYMLGADTLEEARREALALAEGLS
jgi:hypothetical protein